MDSLGYYVPAGVAATAFIVKLPGLIRGRRDPLLRSVGGLLLIASAVFFFAAPPTIAAVNDLTGVPNFSAPLVYSLLTAFCASCLVLVVNWRGGDARTIRRTTRRCCGAYSAVIVALIVLFALGEAPVERLRDLDTYYANTPFLREMIVLYLTAHTVAVVATALLCRRWLREIHGWLRAGVTLLVVGYLLNIVYDTTKFTAVVARWSGRDWDQLSTDLAPTVASLSGIVIGFGFVLPLAGQRATDRWRTHRAFRGLEPLWRELRQAAPGTGAVRVPRWSAPELRLTQRRADIHDGLLLLAPYYDVAVRREAHRVALAHGATAREAAAVAAAALTVAAVRAKTRSEGEGRDPARDAGPGDGPQASAQNNRRGKPLDLAEIAGALRHPVVTELRRRADQQERMTPS